MACVSEAVRQRYAQMALDPLAVKALRGCELGRASAEALGYPADVLDGMPQRVLDSCCPTGYYFKFVDSAALQGAAVLDMGCGTFYIMSLNVTCYRLWA